MFCILSTHIYYIPRAFTPYLYFLEYALFLRRGNKVLIQKIKIICGYNTDLVKNEARNFPKTNKGVTLIWHTQDAFRSFPHSFLYFSDQKDDLCTLLWYLNELRANSKGAFSE